MPDDMAERVADLEDRVKKLESAIWAIALGLSTACSDDGKLIAAPDPILKMAGLT